MRLSEDVINLIVRVREKHGPLKEKILEFMEEKIARANEDKRTIEKWVPMRTNGVSHDPGLIYVKMIDPKIQREEWVSRIVVPSIGAYHTHRHTIHPCVADYWAYEFLLLHDSGFDELISTIIEKFPRGSKFTVPITQEYSQASYNAMRSFLETNTLQSDWDIEVQEELVPMALYKIGYVVARGETMPNVSRNAFNHFSTSLQG
jgi:hypothetical protein